MDDSFSKLVSIIIAIILLCVVPAFYISLLTDYNHYNYKNNEITTYLNEIIYKGIIPDNELLQDDNFNIVVKRDVYIPSSPDLKTMSFTKNTIIDKLSNEKNIFLEKGDVVTVIYKNTSNNSNIFIKKIFDINNNDEYISYMGVVTNESF